MKQKTTILKHEQIIKFLIDKYNNGNTNEIAVSRKDCQILNIPESEISRILHTLQQDGLIIIKSKSVHNDFSMFWTIALKSSCINYFEIKSQKDKTNRREWVRTYVPITISFIALIKSFLPEIMLLMKLITQLLK